MATNRKSTLTKVGKAVKKAARTVAAKADKYVVKPVGKALGVKGKKTAAKSSGFTSIPLALLMDSSGAGKVS